MDAGADACGDGSCQGLEDGGLEPGRLSGREELSAVPDAHPAPGATRHGPATEA